MDDLSGALETLGELLDDAREIVAALRAMREAYTHEQWEEMEDTHPTIIYLTCTCADLEATLGD